MRGEGGSTNCTYVKGREGGSTNCTYVKGGEGGGTNCTYVKGGRVTALIISKTNIRAYAWKFSAHNLIKFY